MTEIAEHLIEKTPDPSCEPFINKCLQILDKRYRESKSGKTYWLVGTNRAKKFSERELTDETGLNWPALKDGRRRTNPSREMVMMLADYLECSLNERNDLLVAASYTPAEVLLANEQLEEALKPCRLLLYKYLHYPAMIINRDWTILEVNPGLFKLLEVEPQTLAALPTYQRNMLWLLFDPNFPLRQLLERLGHEDWQQSARRELLGFRWENQLCKYEDWYVKLISNLKTLPDFAQLYAVTDPANYSQYEGLNYIFKFRRSNSELLTVRGIFARTGNWSYPQLVFFVPGDKYTETIFNQLGMAIPAWADNYILL